MPCCTGQYYTAVRAGAYAQYIMKKGDGEIDRSSQRARNGGRYESFRLFLLDCMATIYTVALKPI